MAKTRTSTAVKQRYNEKAYDRLAITVPKGQKERVETYAKAQGKSVNGLVNAFLRDALQLTEEQWRNPSGEE